MQCFVLYKGFNLIKYASPGTGTRTLHNEATDVIRFARDSLL